MRSRSRAALGLMPMRQASHSAVEEKPVSGQPDRRSTRPGASWPDSEGRRRACRPVRTARPEGRARLRGLRGDRHSRLHPPRRLRSFPGSVGRSGLPQRLPLSSPSPPTPPGFRGSTACSRTKLGGRSLACSRTSIGQRCDRFPADAALPPRAPYSVSATLDSREAYILIPSQFRCDKWLYEIYEGDGRLHSWPEA